jgi:hypothetical protein
VDHVRHTKSLAEEKSAQSRTPAPHVKVLSFLLGRALCRWHSIVENSGVRVMRHLYELPASRSLGKGLFGYSFGAMLQKDLEVLFIESETGHDTVMICRGVVRTYYKQLLHD